MKQNSHKFGFLIYLKVIIISCDCFKIPKPSMIINKKNIILIWIYTLDIK